MRSLVLSFFSLADAKIYWVFVTLSCLYTLLGEINTESYALPVVAALVMAGLVLRQVKYSWMSFVSIFTLAHVIAFPVGVLFVLSLSDASLAIEPDVWETTSLGLFVMIVSMCGLILGVFISRLRIFSNKLTKLQPIKYPNITPVWFNLGLTLLIIPAVIIYIRVGIYYHKDVTGIEGYSFENAGALGFVGYLFYVVYGGVILQIRRYLNTGLKRDLIYTFICISLPLLAMLPSGSRANSMIFCALALIYFMQKELRVKLKYFVLIFCLSTFLLLTISVEAYRLSALTVNSSSFLANINLVFESFSSLDTQVDGEVARAIIGRRLSDIYSVGHLASVIPKYFPHRGFDGMTEFFYYFVPTVFRPEINLDFNYDALLMLDKYQFRVDTGGSSPMMISGELYERFGWFGTLLGMAFIGVILSHLDRWVRVDTTRRTLVWAMIFYGVINLHTYSLLKFFTLVTRQLLIFLLIAYFLERVLYVLGRVIIKKSYSRLPT